jgi:hypothetical protein
MELKMQKWSSGLVVGLLFTALVIGGCAKGNKGSISTSVTDPSAAAFQPKGTIQGKVLDSSTREPIVNAIVTIGLAAAVTNAQGQYVLANVPATTDALNGTIVGQYDMTVDLRAVNSPVKMATAASATNPHYPQFTYQNANVKFTSLNDSSPCPDSSTSSTDVSNNCGTNNTNHDTPVDGLVSNQDVQVGKLDANIQGVVAGCGNTNPDFTNDFFTPVPNAIVNLVSYSADISGSNSTTGSDHVVATATADASGVFVFNNIEANRSFTIQAFDATPPTKQNLSYSVSSPDDGQTKYLQVQQSTAVHICPIDSHGPSIIAVSPEPGSDLTAGAQTVVFTFSEAVANTATIASTDPSNQDGLINNGYLEVQYDGAKGTGIPYTAAWTAPDTLTVTFDAATGTSSLYHVALAGLDKLVDASGNGGDAGNCPNNTGANWPVSVSGGPYTCVVYFSTNGGATPGTPVLTLVNSASLDEGGSTTGIFDWLPVSGAKTYNLYCTVSENFGAGPQVGATTRENGSPLLSSDDQVDFSFVEFNHVPLTYDCYVKGVNSDGVEGPPSISVPVADVIGPKLLADGGLACGSFATNCNSNGLITKIKLKFNEFMDEASTTAVGNYTIAVASGTAPTVDSVFYDPTSAPPSVLLTLSAPQNPATLNVSVITAGPNGVINSLPAVSDDVVTRPTCVTAGPNGFLDSTTASDDQYSGNLITVGANGVCDTTAAGDDLQTIPAGNGSSTTLVCVLPGANGVRNTVPGGDDVISGANITAGPNGVCESVKAGDDVQNAPNGSGLNATSISAGPNNVLDTSLSGDDVLTSGAGVKTSGLLDVNGNAMRFSADEYNVDGTVQ